MPLKAGGGMPSPALTNAVVSALGWGAGYTPFSSDLHRACFALVEMGASCRELPSSLMALPRTTFFADGPGLTSCQPVRTLQSMLCIALRATGAHPSSPSGILSALLRRQWKTTKNHAVNRTSGIQMATNPSQANGPS